MLSFINDNLATILILGVLLVLAVFAVKSLFGRKKKDNCSCGCPSCPYSDKCG